MKEINKVCVIEKVFDAKKTVYDDTDTHIEGYDGEHSNNILFNTKNKSIKAKPKDRFTIKYLFLVPIASFME